MLEHVDAVRKEIGQQLNQRRKAELGQFMTPATVARFMASLYTPSSLPTVRLLDAGAGIGSLLGAFLDRRISSADFTCNRVQLTAYEVDAELRAHLTKTLTTYQAKLELDALVSSEDFIEEAVKLLMAAGPKRFTHAILNPPYKKINSASRHRLLLRKVGIETVNLYSAFVALTVELIQPGGQIVAIIPRSFCNGPYYRPFREFILSKTAIKHIHLFGARDQAFKDDAVLQENIIILLERNVPQGDITITTSTDDRFFDLRKYVHSFDRIVFRDDPEHFIHIPTSSEYGKINPSPVLCYALKDIGLEVSTGPVVDFRLREHLHQMPEPGTVPLLYSNHFVGHSIQWPKPDIKKPNAIHHNNKTN